MADAAAELVGALVELGAALSRWVGPARGSEMAVSLAVDSVRRWVPPLALVVALVHGWDFAWPRAEVDHRQRHEGEQRYCRERPGNDFPGLLARDHRFGRD